tara:strand:- start:263 stop:1198 length:936 start_codon:yes stop_codon:yes gene_type:complete
MGGAPKNTTSTTTQEPSKFIKPYLSDLYSGAQATSRKKYNPFKGDRIEGFSDDELSAHEGIRGLYDAGPREELGWGLGQTQKSTGLANEAADIGRNIGQFDQEAFDRYSSPYFENVLDIEKRNARSESANAYENIAAREALQGGYGSMRHGIMDAENMKNSQQNLADIDARGRQQAWENALSAHTADQQAQVAGGELMLQSGDALQQAASQAMDFADTQQAQAMERIAAMEASGMNQREMEQAIKDMAYADFIDKRDWRQNQQSWLASILGGFAVPMSTSQMMSSPGPSGAGQAAGAVAAAAGAYGMYQNS